MKVHVLLTLVTQIFVISAITVPPIWPSKNGFIREETTSNAPIITHGQFKFPSFFPEDIKRSQDQFNLQVSPSNYQNVHIYHPPPIRPNTEVQNTKIPQSFQSVTNPKRRISKRRPIKKKLPVVHQHLTEVTPTPTNLIKPAATNLQITRNIPHHSEPVESEESKESQEEISEHEHPKEVPTRPIYPGEGQWAKYGLKHNPNPNHKEIKVQETAEDEDERPEGYETFERGEEQFSIARNKFKNNLALFPQKHSLPQSKIDDQPEEKPLYEKPEIGFVPQKLYTQVRRTENEKHLPRSAIDPDEENAERLRETIKDSIIHTVYTEEGYEDSAYDHAGHEKNAENNEGHAESLSDQSGTAEKGHGRGNSRYSDEGGRRYGHNNVARKLKNEKKANSEDFEDNSSYQNIKKKIEHDAEEASSNHEAMKVSNKSELPKKEFKKVTIKNNDQEDVNMEIHTEIKYTPQLKKHKYIKIIPSVKETTSHKRVKRYDKEELSKRYVRKRPSYYWKRKRTTTTERTQISSKNFENTFKTTLKKKPVRTTTEVPQEIPQTTTTTTSAPTSTSSTTPYTITLPPSISKTISTTPTHPVHTSGISPPKIVEELHPDLMNPELTTKASKPSSPKVLPVKIKKFIKKRPKRYAIDYPKININLNEFVDVDKLPNPTEKADLTFIKYPYYNLPISEQLNENSPLRYAEDIKQIPQKVENEMSFYESRNHVICKEVENGVNPVPDRVQNQEEGEETDKMAEKPDLPRLKGLGDKIDCFKEKYFGENPLDSPFFQEDIIDTPIPLFMLKNLKKPLTYKSVRDKKQTAAKAMYYKMRKLDDGKDKMQMKLYKFDKELEQQSDGQNKKRELKIKILEPIVVLDEDYVEATTMNPIHKTTEAVLKPPYNLEQMMSMHNKKYVKFNPENDFHQITLLEQKESKEESKEETKPDKFVIIYENHDMVEVKPQKQKKKTVKPEKKDTESRFSERVSELTSSSFTTTSIPNPETYTRRHFIKRPTKKPITKLSVKTIKKPTLRTTTTSTASPETTTYYYTTKKVPYYSEIIPKPSRLFQTSTTTTEKYAKLEKFEPSEKLEPPEKPLEKSSESQESAEPEQMKNIENTENIERSQSVDPTALPENWPTLNRQLSAFYNIFDITQYFPQISNHRYVPIPQQYTENITPSQQMKVYDDVLKTINKDKSKTEQEKPEIEESQETSSEEAILVQSSLPVRTTTEQNTDYSENIPGLVPPPNSLPYQQVYQYYNQYRLSPPPSEEQIAEASKNYKTFYFLGLTPPKTEHTRKKRDLTDDLLAEESHIDKNYMESNHKRIKRTKHQLEPEDDLMAAETSQYSSPPRRQKVYTEIVRNRPSRPQTEEPEEEEEDLNPRKRIYELRSSRPTTTESSPQYEEVEELVEEEITEAPTTTTRRPRIYPVEANKQNPQIAEYLVFIGKIKEKWAKEDATSTTTTTTTTEAPKTPAIAENRGEPAFLQLINQLHQIRKEQDEKTTTTTTTEPEIEITSAQVQTIPIKNSNPFLAEMGLPDFMSELKSMQLNLEHDNTAEGSTNPEISRSRNYINRFRTSVDTSKYKTIERNPVTVRHNLSSRYNANDEELPLDKGQTTQTPMIIAIITSEPQLSSTESPEEQEIIAKVITERILEDTTQKPDTTTTSTTTTTTIKSRQRGRGRPRPPTITTTQRPITSSTINPLFRRRRPTRPSTTTTSTSSPVNTNVNQFRRRNRLKASETRSLLPSNHKPIAEETTETTVVITPPSEEPKKQRRFQKVQERRVTSEVTLTRYFEPLSDEESAETPEETKKHQYEIIGPLTHTDTGHGGNYKHEHEPVSEEDTTTTLTSPESYFSDPNLAEDVNLLKDAQQQQEQEENTKPQASNNLFTNEEISEKVALQPLHAKVSLYPNMARMVNRLADTQTQINEDDDKTQVNEDGKKENEDKPVFVKDPSRRMYYYAKL